MARFRDRYAIFYIKILLLFIIVNCYYICIFTARMEYLVIQFKIFKRICKRRVYGCFLVYKEVQKREGRKRKREIFKSFYRKIWLITKGRLCTDKRASYIHTHIYIYNKFFSSRFVLLCLFFHFFSNYNYLIHFYYELWQTLS